MLTGTCAVCGSADAKTTIDRAVDYITEVAFVVRQCSTCGLARTEPQPSSMDLYYPRAYRQYSGITLRILKLLYGWRVRHWIRRFPRGGRALEVGCGDGWMLGVLRDRGWRVYGNERSLEGARGAKAANQISMFVGDLDALRPTSPFNLIILFQVLEHLADPLTTLRRSAGLLDAGGIVIVAVPNFASWQARLFGGFWFHLDVPRHLCHHSPRSLSYAFEQAGLRIFRTRFVSFEHDPYGWVQSSLNKLGFNQNLLTKWLMGMDTEAVSPLTLAAMLVVAGLLVVPSVVAATCSWAVGSGAIIEVWGAKA